MDTSEVIHPDRLGMSGRTVPAPFKVGDVVQFRFGKDGSTYTVADVQLHPAWLVGWAVQLGTAIWYPVDNLRLYAPPAEAQPVPAKPDLPDQNPKTRYGIQKPQLGLVPASAMVEISEAMRLGKEKYTEANWRDQPVSASTYFHAALRHLYAWWDGQDYDPQLAPAVGPHHLGSVASNAAILLDAMACGTLIDDRPTKGAGAQSIVRRTRG